MAGRHDSTSDVIREGLRMAEDRERQSAALDAAIKRGIADADAGRVRSIDEARAELREQLSSRGA